MICVTMSRKAPVLRGVALPTSEAEHSLTDPKAVGNWQGQLCEVESVPPLTASASADASTIFSTQALAQHEKRDQAPSRTLGEVSVNRLLFNMMW